MHTFNADTGQRRGAALGGCLLPLALVSAMGGQKVRFGTL